MRTYNIEANINGHITFEVVAKNIEEAQEKVDDILKNPSVKEAIEEYKKEIDMQRAWEEE